MILPDSFATVLLIAIFTEYDPPTGHLTTVNHLECALLEPMSSKDGCDLGLPKCNLNRH
jgi:hypothetical protein